MPNMNVLENNGIGSRKKVNGLSQPIRPLIGAVQNTPFSATEGTSNPVAANTFEVRLTVDVDARILINNTVAASTGVRLIADQPEWFEVQPGDVIHAIAE